MLTIDKAEQRLHTGVNVKLINLAIVGIGNCASSLVQGLEHYRGGSNDAAGLMHWEVGGYEPSDIKVVAAWDVDTRKVGKDVAEAIFSLRSGERVMIDPPATIADGVRTREPGKLTFEVMRALATGVVTVTEDAIKDAVRFMVLRMKTVVEPTGAIPAAALLTRKVPAVAGRRVGVIVSGGNVDPDVLAAILTETL